jgi:N-methylhydantoinase B
MDVIDLEVLNNRLQAIAEEAQFTLEHSAHSPSVREGADCSAGLFDADGRMISQATAIPVHLGSLEPAVQGLLRAFPPDRLEAGDICIMNDPYAGGQHYPDIIMLAPIMHGGQLVAMHCNLGHHQDIGGVTPGGNPTNATETYQEGLCVPPVKLYDRGVLNEAVKHILMANVRIPDTVWGDVQAQIAACHVAAERVNALIDAVGAENFRSGAKQLQDLSERMTRQALDAVPDGVYSFHDFLDNDGIDLDRLVRIQVTVTVHGSNLTADFTGTDTQCKGPFNSVPPVALSAVCYVVRCIAGPDIPNNSGCFRMIKLSIPEGTVLNPISPAPVSCRAVTLRRVVDAVMGAMAQALPDIVPAASNGHPFSQRLGGQRVGGGAWVTSIIGTGGMGARPTKDGVDAIQTDASNSQNIPIEFLETYLPMRVLEYSLRPDSGGPGLHRGGLGLIMRYQLLSEPVVLTNRGERYFTQPWGLYGGMPGASSAADIRRTTGDVEPIPSKGVFSLGRDDVVDVFSAGGGGHGDPVRRPPHLVAEDVRLRKVSAVAAREAYGVAVDETTFAVLVEETADLRSKLAARRPTEGMIFDRGVVGVRRD